MAAQGMLTGHVIKLNRTKGFGFLKDEKGQERFFHRSDARDFDRMNEGDSVRLMPVPSPANKGPRAAGVELL
jgi:cold shock CspA family protein